MNRDFWRLLENTWGQDFEEDCLELYRQKTGRHGVDSDGYLTEGFCSWMAEYGAITISCGDALEMNNMQLAANMVSDFSTCMPAGKYARRCLQFVWNLLSDSDIEELANIEYTKEHLGPKGSEPVVIREDDIGNLKCYYTDYKLCRNGVAYRLTRNWHDEDRSKLAQWVKDKVLQSRS